MSYKKWVISIVLLFLISYIAVIISVTFIIDPYAETQLIAQEGFNKYKFFESAYTSTNLYDKLKEKKYTLVFGTSRSHQIGNGDFVTPVLNFHSIYGSPYAVYNFLTQLNKQQIKNIDTIYYLLDDLTFNGTTKYTYVNYTNQLSKLVYITTNTNISKINSAIATIQRNQRPSELYITENGSVKFLKALPPFDPKMNGHIEPQDVVQSRQKFTSDAFEMLGKVDSFAKQNRIKIIYFTPLLTLTYLHQSNQKFFSAQRERFVQQINGFYNLSYIPEISNNNLYFSDSSHTNINGKNVMLQILKNKEKKYFITRQTLQTKKTISPWKTNE